MKRNLFGFALFAAILTVTIIAYKTFLAPSVVLSSAIEITNDWINPPSIFDEQNSLFCEIKQAALDLQTKKLDVELRSCGARNFEIHSCGWSEPPSAAAPKQTFVRLTAFVKKSSSPDDVKLETFVVPVNFNQAVGRTYKISVSADQLVDSQQIKANLQDNLYLIIQNSEIAAEETTTPIAFDKRWAAPVLLVTGK